MVELADGTCRSLTPDERRDPDTFLPPGSRLFSRERLASQGESTTGRSAAYTWNGQVFPCPPGRHWTVDPQRGIGRLSERNRLVATDGGELRWKQYEGEIPGRKVHNLWPIPQAPTDMHYVVETAESVIERCILMATDPGDLVLDPTCGSGTTAAVAERWGRRWITIDASAIPVALCRQRILASVHKWYITLDDSEGHREEARLADRLRDYEQNLGPSRSGADPSAGFVYQRVPYVSAAHLAYDEPPKTTLLVNQPVVKKGVKRISAPFTVESHSPWIYLSPSAPEADERTTERETGIRISAGDALFIRTGVWDRREAEGPWLRGRREGGRSAGLHPSVIPWLRERDVAVLGSDHPAYVAPSNLAGAVHDFAILHLGIHMLDNCDLRALAELAAERDRWEFLLMLAPLAIPGGTGSPLNPIAVF